MARIVQAEPWLTQKCDGYVRRSFTAACRFIGQSDCGIGDGAGGRADLVAQILDSARNGADAGGLGGGDAGATFFSLLQPAMEIVIPRDGPLMGFFVVALSMTLGGGVIWLMHDLMPHEHPGKGYEGGAAVADTNVRMLSRPLLLAGAIALHNIPEGLSVGVSFSGPDSSAGLALTTGIALQNMPEGLAVAAAMIDLGVKREKAFLIALASGLAEPVAALFAVGAITLASSLVPWALAFAAGAMLFVICGEVIPETYEETKGQNATLALMAGFILMLGLTILFA